MLSKYVDNPDFTSFKASKNTNKILKNVKSWWNQDWKKINECFKFELTIEDMTLIHIIFIVILELF